MRILRNLTAHATCIKPFSTIVSLKGHILSHLMEQPTQESGSEENADTVAITNRIAQWVTETEPSSTSPGVERYDNEDMKDPLRKDVSKYIGPVHVSRHHCVSWLINTSAKYGTL